MINGGYYIKARCIQNSEIAHCSPAVREIWDWLLLNARHKSEKYNGSTIERGQLFCTYSDIRDGLSWYVGYRKMSYSENVTKHAMKKLRELCMIETTKKPRGVIVTVCNYNTYQDPKNYERTNVEPLKEPATEPIKHHRRPSINKECKNVKNEKKNKQTGANAPDMVYGLFESFYESYPVHIKKSDTYKWFLKNKPDNEMVSMMIGKVKEQIAWRETQSSAGAFVPQWPAPIVWLNGKRWEDELTPPATATVNYLDGVRNA